MRATAVLLVGLLLLPLAQGEAQPRADFVVLLSPGAHVDAPAGSVPLRVVPGFVAIDAPLSLARDLAATRGVERVQLAEPLELDDAPLAASGPDDALRLTRADEANLSAFGADGAGVAVAVVDSGIDATHPDLAGRVAGNWRLVDGAFLPAAGDTNGHGTHVAGIVAASGASSRGARPGTAPGASLVGLDILSESFTTASAMLAYDWLDAHHAEYGIRVVVNAWGRTGEPRTFDPDDVLVRAIDKLVEDGVVVVFSAGNHGPAPRTLSVEAQDPHVVTVGAVDDAGVLARYSSVGPVTPVGGGASWIKPDVVAPGDRIVGLRSQESAPDPTTDPDPLHRELSGTSQAAPHVAGLLARMIEANPALTPRQAQDALRASAIDLGPVGPDPAYGYGLVDAPDALRAASGRAVERDNPLVAGGTESYDDAATQGSASGRALLGLASPTDASWETRLPVKPGATALAFEADAGAPAASLRATLLDPDGAPSTWSADSPTTVRGRLDAPAPGVWTLRVEAQLLAPATLAAHAEVSLGPNATRAALYDPRYRPPDEPAPDAVTPRTLGERALLLARDEPWIAPLAALALGAPLASLAYATARRPKRAPPAPDAAPPEPPAATDAP